MAISTRASHPADGQERPVVVVTGASAGIGRATAIAFGRMGWRVALVARGLPGLEAARRDVESVGGEALVLQADVGDAAAVHAAADQVRATWKHIDVWINNAMLSVFGNSWSVPPAEWERVTRATYLGAVHGTLAALEGMRERNRGTIVQVGSALAYRSIPLQAPYCGAKSAMRAFTDSLRSELLHAGSRVRVSMVHLPGVNTPQFEWTRTHMATRHRPVGPVYHADAAANAIVHAALNAPRELWVGAPVLQAVLGTMLGPGLLDRLLARTAYGPQQASGRHDTRFDILDAPAPSDHGVEGPYTEGARRHAVAVNPAALRGGVVLALLGAVAAAVLGRRSG
jgi:NADP-dependent 3-hydroxy acid dehydrogenase YdfG